jgi:hypothetical protein
MLAQQQLFTVQDHGLQNMIVKRARAEKRIFVMAITSLLRESF